ITRGDTSIKFKQSVNPTLAEQQHKAGTLADMAKVMSTNTGRKVIGDLSNRARTTTLEPTADPNALSNSTSTPDAQGAHFPRDGANASIQFRPGFDKKKEVTGLPVDITSDTSLLHEMVHAHHYTDGMRANGNLTNVDLGDGHQDIGVGKEEYATVGL